MADDYRSRLEYAVYHNVCERPRPAVHKAIDGLPSAHTIAVTANADWLSRQAIVRTISEQLRMALDSSGYHLLHWMLLGNERDQEGV